ncbi:MAG TPA: 5-formyltetrahydrofolate cyclo-ligase [Ruminococcaceae bacterium]|nr:5-formyltetrahydrofolate cyclo-ligase [Oscillospiraceae bacterium]
MREIKNALRKELISRRKAMNSSQKLAADIDIFEQIKELIDNSEAVFTYASTEIEVDTRRIIDYCLERNIPVALPVSGDEEIEFFYIGGTDKLKKGRYGIDEPPQTFPAAPSEQTLCIVPALCADGKGLRLGYGKGYYDRFLSRFPGKSVIICYDEFRREVPAETHDRKADYTFFNRKTVNNGRK